MPTPPSDRSDEPVRPGRPLQPQGTDRSVSWSGPGVSPRELGDLWVIARKAAFWAGAGDADADDVAQVVTERLWRTWERPHIRTARRRGSASWNAYVAVAARNAWRDLDRSHRRRRTREITSATSTARVSLPIRPGSSHHASVPPTLANEIDEYLARLEIVEVIKTQLTHRQQQVAWHIFVDGWSVIRVANELGLSQHTIRRHKAKAIACIRAALLGGQES